MPTPLMPDEEFDAHFRRGLEHYSGPPDAPDAPDAWQRMDALLDAEPPARRCRAQRRAGVATLVLLLLVAGLSLRYQQDLRRWATDRASQEKQGSKQKQLASQPQPLATATPQRLPASHTAPRPAAAATASQPTPAQPATIEAATTAGVTTTAVTPVVAAATMRAAASNTNGEHGTSSSHSTTNRLPLPSTEQAATTHNRHLISTLTAPPARRKAQLTGEGHLVATHTAAGTALLKKTKRPLELATNAAKEQTKRRAKSGISTTAVQSRRHLGYPLLDKASKLVTSSDYLENTTLAPAPHSRRARRRNAARQPGNAVAATTSAGHYPTALQRKNASQEKPQQEEQESFAALATQPKAGASGPPQAVELLAGTGLPGWPFDSLPAPLSLARVTPFDSLPTPKVLPINTYRLHIGLLASPELSTVRQSAAGLGGSVGIQVEYQLARRWRLSAGYLQAIKKYAAAGSDYRTVPAWPSSWVLDGVTANCRIIDVPLNLRYDVWQGPQRRAFVSGGLSSLFMRREDYDYKYDVGGKTYSSAWQFLNNSNHPFQVLNLSVGYEQSLSPRWALQVEPYFKLPLGGIGYGAVRLQSAGVFFSLKYGLLRGPAAR